MADNELPPLIDNDVTKNVMDFNDDVSDIFVSTTQDHTAQPDILPYNKESIYVEIPKLSLRDTLSENSLSILSTPVSPSNSLIPTLDSTNININDLHEVPINDNDDALSTNIIKSESLEEISNEYPDMFIEIIVASPQKMGDGMGSYVAYKIETKTNIQIYRKSSFSVNRRFSDFLGLHDKLTEKYLRGGRIIPPAPEKNVIGSTKVKISGEKNQEQNHSSTEFLERRRAALERFLNRLAAHNIFRLDPDFKKFLEADMELPKATNTCALSGAAVMRLFSKVGETVNKITYKMDENDTWFEEICNHIDSLDIQLRNLHESVESLTNQRKDLSICTGATARSIAVLGHGEPSASLGRALAQLAETFEKVEIVRKAQGNSDLFQFGEMIRDYVALIGAIKDVFHERVKVFQNWQHAQIMLNKKREQKARIEQSNRSEKTSQITNEVIEWEAKVDRGQEEFNNISKIIRKEVERFEAIRIQDFKKQLIQYLETMLQHQYQLINHWESFLSEAKTIV